MSTPGLDEVRFRSESLEKFSDWINPLLVKEVRQALKSRGFLVVFSLLVLVCWLISVFGVTMAGETIRYAGLGPWFFLAYYYVLAFATFLIVPSYASRSMMAEREHNTYEMLQITTLSPKRIVWGKWWSVMTQTLVYYAAIAPFMVFTSLLRGLSLWPMAIILFWSLMGTGMLSMLAIVSATMGKQKQSQALVNVGSVLAGLWMMGMAITASTAAITQDMPLDQWWFWCVQFAMLTFVVPIFILLRQVAAVNLMFEGSNRSTGVRITAATLTGIWLTWIILAGYASSYWPSLSLPALSTDVLEVWAICIALWLALVTLFAVTEDERFSRRVRREMPVGALARLWRLPFLPGAGRGWVYSLLQLAAYTLLLTHVASIAGADWDRVLLLCCLLCAYILFYGGLASVFARLFRSVSGEAASNYARVVGVVMVPIGALGPHLLELVDYTIRDRLPALFVTNPFYIIGGLYQYHNLNGAPLLMVFVLGSVGLLLNLPCLARGIDETFSAKAPAPSRKLLQAPEPATT